MARSLVAECEEVGGECVDVSGRNDSETIEILLEKSGY